VLKPFSPEMFSSSDTIAYLLQILKSITCSQEIVQLVKINEEFRGLVQNIFQNRDALSLSSFEGNSKLKNIVSFNFKRPLVVEEKKVFLKGLSGSFLQQKQELGKVSMNGYF